MMYSQKMDGRSQQALKLFGNDNPCYNQEYNQILDQQHNMQIFT